MMAGMELKLVEEHARKTLVAYQEIWASDPPEYQAYRKANPHPEERFCMAVLELLAEVDRLRDLVVEVAEHLRGEDADPDGAGADEYIQRASEP